MIDKIRRVVGILLIIIGVGIIGVTAWVKYDGYRNQKAIIEAFNNLSSFDEGEYTEVDATVEGSGIPDIDAIGFLKVPKLGVEIGLVEGVEKKDIKYAAGHFPGTPLPGEEGNFAFACHRRSTTLGDLFKKADELVTGDEFFVTYNGQEYVYEVTESYIVSPEETNVLDDTPGDATMTFVTCTLDSKSRLITKGKLKQ